MHSLNYLQKTKNTGLLAVVAGVVLGIPLVSSSASAQTLVTPICPGLYYQEPWNGLLNAPLGCPSNERTLSGEQVQINEPDYVQPTYRVVPPLPEVISEPVAYIRPTADGTIDVMLNNDTDAMVTYQVIGHTGERGLRGREEVILRNLPTPVTITMIREDNGLLQFMTTGSDSEYLHVTLDEDPTFDDIQGVLRIQSDGGVFLN